MHGEPYEVVDAAFSRMQQRKAVVQAKIRNLKTGKVTERNFQPSDQFPEAQVRKTTLQFLYMHRNEYVFVDPADLKKRSTIEERVIGDYRRWLKPHTDVTALFFDDALIGLRLPIKMDFAVTEAPPGIQGDRSTSGNKSVTIETGTVVQAPLFMNTGDIIRVNTETGDYVERVEKK